MAGMEQRRDELPGTNQEGAQGQDALPSFAYAKRHGVLVTGIADDRVDVKVRPDVSMTALAELRRALGRPLQVERIPAEQFDTELASAYQKGSSQAALAMEDISESGEDLFKVAQALPEPEDLLDSEDDAPIIRLINAILTEAIKENASDVHIETYETRMVVRFRVDGVMREVLEPPRALAPLLVSRIKVMARLDIAEKRLPQDGRISLRLAGRAVDVRVSTLPSGHGERVVMRLLDKQVGRLDLEHLGMSPETHATVDRLIRRPHGIMLVTGPTGSGKTTTLYAGEIRDLETAEIAVQASLTGHLVLSTLHTNSAVGAVTRLRDMGVEPFLVSSSLIAVIAQRLVRLLCPECKTPYEASERDCEVLGVPADAPPTLYRAVGCKACNQTGYQGRSGIYELIEIDEQMARMIHDGIGEHEMESYVRTQTPSLREDGVRRVLAGDTTLEEVLRVTRES